METSNKMAYVRSREKAKNYVGIDSLFAILVDGEDSGDRFSVIEIVAGQGAAMPWHQHLDQDETFYVLDGEVEFDVADQSFKAVKGSFISIPKGIGHRFEVKSESARILNSFYPAGFEKLIVEHFPEQGSFGAGIGTYQADWSEIAARDNGDFTLLNGEVAENAFLGKIQPYMHHRETSPALWNLGILWVVMANSENTGGSHSFIDELIPHGPSASPHIHQRAQEIFYILDGEMTFFAGDEWEPVTAKANSLVVVPEGTQHAFKVDSPTVHLVNIYTPAGFEYIIEGNAVPATAMTLQPKNMPPKEHDNTADIFEVIGKKYPGALTKRILPEDVHNETVTNVFHLKN